MSERHWAPAAAGIGIAYVAAGVVLLLHQLEIITLRWGMVLPVAFVVLGGSLVIVGAMGRARTSAGTGGSGPDD